MEELSNCYVEHRGSEFSVEQVRNFLLEGFDSVAKMEVKTLCKRIARISRWLCSKTCDHIVEEDNRTSSTIVPLTWVLFLEILVLSST